MLRAITELIAKLETEGKQTTILRDTYDGYLKGCKEVKELIESSASENTLSDATEGEIAGWNYLFGIITGMRICGYISEDEWSRIGKEIDNMRKQIYRLEEDKP